MACWPGEWLQSIPWESKQVISVRALAQPGLWRFLCSKNQGLEIACA